MMVNFLHIVDIEGVGKTQIFLTVYTTSKSCFYNALKTHLFSFWKLKTVVVMDDVFINT